MIKGNTLCRQRMDVNSLEEHKDPLHFWQEGYDAFQEISHRWGICISMCRLGLAYLGMGKITEAKDRLYEALCLAHENQMTPLILNALAGLACVLVREGETERSLELYQLVHEHPQTPIIYLDLAERWFSDLELPSFRDKSNQSEEKDESRSLDQIVESILIEMD